MSTYTPNVASQDEGIEFTTLGMFIIDEIHYGPDSNRKVAENIIGGAGTFALIGARIFSPPPFSRRLGWIVDAGHDFPVECRAQLESLHTTLVLRETPERATTRGWNSYGNADHREFRYLTPKKRLEAIDLFKAGLGSARCVHLICSPSRASDLNTQLSSKADGIGRIVVWEPVPDRCTPEHREKMFETAKHVDVISPNSDELRGFFSDLNHSHLSDQGSIQFLASKLVESGIGPNNSGSVVVRAGKKGCLIMCNGHSPIWLPAYYDTLELHEGNHPKVIDPTGGGNTFIGGLGVSLVRSGGDICLAAAFGIIAASLAIEQIGIPILRFDDTGEELWNGIKVKDRLNEYLKRLYQLGIVLNDGGAEYA